MPVPWLRGHELARRLRTLLNLDSQPLATFGALAHVLQASDAAALMRDGTLPTASGPPFDALMAGDVGRRPGFVTTARGDRAQRFAVCRALYEYFPAPGDEPRLITRARTAEQQSNRAFAAEFLAPVAALRQRLTSAEPFDEEADEIADEFGVSALVVRHQLENHGVNRSRVGLGAGAG
jgi:hypothetical protein